MPNCVANRNRRPSGYGPMNFAEPLEPRRMLAGAAPEAGPPTAAISDLALINAGTGQPVPGVSLTNGSTIDLAQTGYRLDIRADLSAGTAASVRFNYDGNPDYRIDNSAPYDIAGGRRHAAWLPSIGTHALVVTPYSGRDGTGTPGASLLLLFNVLDSSPAPLPTYARRPSRTLPGEDGPAHGPHSIDRPAPASIPAPVYVNAGGLSYTDSLARTFAPGTGFIGGATSQVPFSVGAAIDAPLFYSYRSGSRFNFSRPVADGDYELFLDFTDPTSTGARQRVFNVFAQGTEILDHYDIVADAGPQHTVVKAFDLQVTGGRLDLAFQGVTGDAIVSSVVLIPKDIPPAVMPYTIQCARQQLQYVRDGENLFRIGYAMMMYANNQTRNGSAFPSDLVTMFESGGLRPDFMASPRTTTLIPRGEMSAAEQAAWVSTLNDYIYLGAGKHATTVSPSTPLVYDNPDRVAGDINVLFGDGYVGELTRDAAAKLIGFVPAAPTHAPPPPDPSAPACRYDPAIVLSAGNLFQIGWGAIQYANLATRNGRPFPPDLGRMASFSDLPPGIFVDPRGSSLPPPAGMTPQQTEAWINGTTDYIYAPGRKRLDNTLGTTVLAYENPANMKDGILILFADGHVEFREMRWAIETILHDQAAFGQQ